MATKMTPSPIRWRALLVCLLIPLGVGGLAAALTSGSMDVYKALRQPPLAPPGWVFPVVWTLLYTMMGIACYLVWVRDSTGLGGALFWYGAQLLCNLLWTLLFFNMKQYGLAFFWLLGLWALVLITVVRFFKETPAAGWLLLPYLLWVSFAAYLNLGVWLLNQPKPMV